MNPSLSKPALIRPSGTFSHLQEQTGEGNSRSILEFSRPLPCACMGEGADRRVRALMMELAL